MIAARSVRRLGESHEDSLQELLEADPEVNVFLLGFLGVHPMDRSWWIGETRGDRVDACVLIIPGRLCVPYAPDPAALARIGDALRGAVPPRLLVGPRAGCDALYDAWGRPGRPARWYDQRLYVTSEPPAVAAAPDLRPARPSEWRDVAVAAAAMEREDLGIDPSAEDPEVHVAAVKERIEAERTWIISRDGEIVFQINVGTSTPWGCQVGGTWVPPRHRGTGLATAGMAAFTHNLLQEHPIVTLHVNEANAPAVRVYEKVGYRRAAPFRLAILEDVR